MKRSPLLILALIALLAVAAVFYHLASKGPRPGPTVVEEFQAARQAAENGNLAEAIADYQALLDEGHQTAAIYYNLAGAQHRAGDLGNAILNYERAARLDPGSADIAANLARARKDAAVPEDEASGWQAFSHALAPNAWSIVAAVSLLALAVLAILPGLRRNAPPIRALFATGFVALLAIGLSIAALVTHDRDAASRAIVVKNATPLRVSPFADAKATATLPAGKTVFFSPKDPHHGYRLARLESGQSGWVAPGEALSITPK